MANLRCPACGSDEVEVQLWADAQGQFKQDESGGKCKKCGHKLTLAEIKAALDLK